MRADDAAPRPTGLNHICHLSQPNALVLRAGEGTPDEKFFGNFPYPYMNGLLHLGHAFSLSKVSKRLAAQQRLPWQQAMTAAGDEGRRLTSKSGTLCYALFFSRVLRSWFAHDLGSVPPATAHPPPQTQDSHRPSHKLALTYLTPPLGSSQREKPPPSQ